MKRDLRGTPLFEEIAEHFRRATAPGLGTLSDASDVHASADGRYVAIAGSVADQLEGLPSQRILVYDRAENRSFTVGDRNDDTYPRWSPHDGLLAFVSDRACKGIGVAQIFDVASPGIAAALELDDPVEALAWSPDGSALLLQTAGRGSDRAGAQGSGTLAVDDPSLPDWTPEVEEAVPQEAWRRLWLHRLGSRGARPVPLTGETVWEMAWCGNETILAVTSDDPREGGWYDARLIAISLADGSRRVLYEPEYEIGLPAGSPDGRYAAVVHASCSDRGIVAGDVVLTDLRGGAVRQLDADGVDVTSIGFRDATHLYFTGVRGFETVAGEIDLTNDRVTVFWISGGAALRRYPAVVPCSSAGYVTVAHAYDRPPVLIAIEGGEETEMLDFGNEGTDYVRSIAGTLETLTWTARDGREIGGYLARPSGDGPFPLVVTVHGGPTWCFLNAWQMYYRLTVLLVARGYAVLHPNPRGS
ncbi:MAG TPA: hypothetical protein VMF61_14765, partial [Candidatus Acidoferrales bacterium]|nr:hypothetical protein [Candidatus Acidoferrales bacterium]